MTIDEIYKLVSYMVDKYQGTYLTPEDFNMSVNAAQRQYLNFLTGETAEANQVRSSSVKKGFSEDVTTGGSLTNFLKEDSLGIVAQLAEQPSDFYKISAMRTNDDDNFIRRVGADKVYAYINNSIDAPTITEPIYTEIGKNFKFWPASLGAAKIIYFRKPVDVKWGYTGDLVHDPRPYNPITTPTGSINLEWPENDHMDIVYRTLGIIGINLKDGDLIRVSQTVKNDGQ